VTITAEQILRDAAELLRKDGWIKGKKRSAFGRCMVGALIDASPNVPGFYDPIRNAAFKAVRDLFDGQLPIVTFNDAHCVTADDAIAALEIAADLVAPEWKP
jgi:hypothetical protein